MSNLNIITAKEAFEFLNNNTDSIVIDVRTPDEWKNIGIPSLSDEQIKFITSHLPPNMSFNPEFPELLRSKVTDFSTNLFFICRSNGRSRIAAECAMKFGFLNCHLIVDGFEGSSEGNGWLASKLPSSNLSNSLRLV